MSQVWEDFSQTTEGISMNAYEVTYRIMGENGLARRAVVTAEKSTEVIPVIMQAHMVADSKNVDLIGVVYIQGNSLYTIL
jgi:hypothetical protein